MRVLSSCNAPKILDTSDMEALIACQSEADIKKCHLMVPCDDGGDELCHLTDTKKRKKAISWPSILRRTTAGSETLGHLESDLKPPLFDQPLSIVCSEEDMLPKPIQDIFTILYLKGPFTEGIFRKAANEKARKELKEELNSGGKVVLENEPVHLLAVVLKDFLRNIPHKLLLSELYEEWMTALEKTSQHERTEAMKEVADKLPRPNLLLLKHLLCLLHHISKNSEINKMDSSNLAICIGPNVLTTEHEQRLPLEVQKELTDKVKTLVEFLIDHCSDILGEDSSSFFSGSADDSLDKPPEMLSANEQNDSAYNSADLERENNVSDLQPKLLPQVIRLRHTEERHFHQLRGHPSIGSPLTVFKKSMSNLNRRYSEPDMLSSENCQEGSMRNQKLTKSEESFIQWEELGSKYQGPRKQMAKEFCLAGLHKIKKPPKLTIKTSLPSDLETTSTSLPRTSSSSSLDSSSSVSDNSVFTSSPVTSPAFSKKNLTLSQGSGKPNKELKKHSMSFSVATCKRALTKTQSCGIADFQSNCFKKGVQRERHLSCRVVQGTRANSYNSVPVGYQLRPRLMSADEVFRFVDQRNPGKPPSYEEATKCCPAAKLPSSGSSTVQNMRSTVLQLDCELQQARLNRKVTTNKVHKELFNDRLSLVSDSKDKTPAVDVVIGIHSRAYLPLTPQVYRLRTMSGSYQKNKQGSLNRCCSQPAFECMQCAKESYV